MSDSKRYSINEGQVVAQDFGDQTVIINLAKGFYYSMEGSALLMWDFLAHGYTLPETAEAIASVYDISDDHVLTDITTLLDQIIEHELLVETTNGQKESITTENAADTEYIAPELNVHDDIGHLLALDPPIAGLQNSLDQEPVESN